MLDLSFLDPPIEVAAAGPRLETILTKLRAHGMRAYPASDPIDFDTTEPLLIDMESLPEGLRDRDIRLNEGAERRPVVLLAPDMQVAEGVDALIVSRDSDLAMLKARLTSLVRRQARTAEFRIRMETARAFGVTGYTPARERQPEVLYLGDGGVGFFSLRSALRGHDIPVTAALTLRTAADYLKSGRFAAILADLTPGGGNATNHVDWSRAETALAGTPLFVLTEPGADLSQAHLAALMFSSDLVEQSGDAEALAGRISKAIRNHNASAPVLPAQLHATPSVDADTGLFHRDFIKSHLSRQIALSSDRGEPLCVLTIKLDEDCSEQVTDFAQVIRSCVRDTDCLAHFGNGTIIISAPLTPYRGAIRLAERLMIRISRSPELEGLRLSWRVVEKRSYHTAGMLLAEGLSGPYTREYAA
jgi:PleD family two-component response regulator